MHCGVEVTESSTNKQHHQSLGPEVLSAGCATTESEVIVEVSLAHPYNAGSAGREKGTCHPAIKWGVCFGEGTPYKFARDGLMVEVSILCLACQNRAVLPCFTGPKVTMFMFWT